MRASDILWEESKKSRREHHTGKRSTPGSSRGKIALVFFPFYCEFFLFVTRAFFWKAIRLARWNCASSFRSSAPIDFRSPRSGVLSQLLFFDEGLSKAAMVNVIRYSSNPSSNLDSSTLPHRMLLDSSVQERYDVVRESADKRRTNR